MNDAGRIGFVPRGQYSSSETYDFLDFVTHGNASYVAKKLTAGHEPGENSEYWQMMARVPDGIVTGVKGSAETEYRTGDVEITAENIGAAKASIYGDSTVSLGRKAGTETGSYSLALGRDNEASGYTSAAIGGASNKAKTQGSAVIGGEFNSADGPGYSAVFGGKSNTSSGDTSVSVGGFENRSTQYCSATVGGSGNKAAGQLSAVIGGENCTAGNYASVSIGKNCKPMEAGGGYNKQVGDLFVIGNGASRSALSNALRVTYLGDILGTKSFQSSGADYAEYFEKNTGIGEDWTGYFVTVRDGYIERACSGDYIVGVVSGNPSVIGNADEDYYWRYERDEFNRIVLEDVPELVQKKDADGNPMFDEGTHEPIMEETGAIIKNARMKLADSYDQSLQGTYIPRVDRPEWECVGMLGVIPVRDDGTCIPGRLCKCADGGIATLAMERAADTYMVARRVTDNVVSVILK